jgi:hypothetical protein
MSARKPFQHNPPPVNGINIWLVSEARRMRNYGCPAHDATAALQSFEGQLRRRYQHGEVERAVNLVFGTDTAPGPRCAVHEYSFNPDKLKSVAARLPDATAQWFKSRSPVCVEDMSTESFLHAITNAGERVLCFTTYRSQGQMLWQNHPGLCLTNPTLQLWRRTLEDGAWFLPQPVTGEWLNLDRLKSDHNPTGRTRRSEENVTAFRFALLESDEADTAQWLSALAQLPLPVVSITTSGGRSIHALVLVNAACKAEWDDLVRGALLPVVKPLGADPAALTAVRLTRLPGIHRGRNLQELLYLDMAPTTEPINTLNPCRE